MCSAVNASDGLHKNKALLGRPQAAALTKGSPLENGAAAAWFCGSEWRINCTGNRHECCPQRSQAKYDSNGGKGEGQGDQVWPSAAAAAELVHKRYSALRPEQAGKEPRVHCKQRQ